MGKYSDGWYRGPSDIVLRNQNGTSIVHEGAARVDLQTTEGRVQPFYDLTQLKCYICRPTGVDGQIYVIEDGSLLTSYANYALGRSFVDTAVAEQGYLNPNTGSHSLTFIFTEMELEAGKTYNTRDIFRWGE